MRNDFDLAGCGVFMRRKGRHSAKVVDVPVGVDHRFDGLVGEFPEFLKRAAAFVHVLRWIDDDDSIIAHDHSRARQRIAVGHIDTVGNLVNAGHHLLGVFGELRMDRRSRFIVGYVLA